jgi:TP901 family phage tail tape measure protein
MADIRANIGIGVDTTQALAAIRQLQREISVFHTLMAKGGAQAANESMRLQQNLVNSINETGKFSAGMARISSSTESFTNSLEKNKLSMGQYFRYAGGASKSFGKMFSREFGTISQVAQERVKDLQTQYISLGRDANGALQSIKVRPLALDMDNLGTKVQLAAQKQQLFNQLVKQGTTNLLNFGKNTQWAGRQLMVGFTIPLTIFGATAIREFQKIEEQVVKFRRVYGDMFNTDAETERALSNVRTLAEEFTKYGIAVEKTIDLAAKVAQMGNTGDALTAQVTQATRLAILGGLEQQEALDTTISLTNAFGIAAEDLAGKIAFLNAAENQTILAIEDFNTAIPLSGSVVRQLGGDVEDLAVLLTAMREGGINASQAGNALKSSLGRLIAPSRNAKETLGSFGIDVLSIVNNNAGDLMGTINTLAFALEKLDPLDRARSIEALFGKFQFARMSTMFQNIVKEGSQANKVLGLTANSAAELSIIAERELKRVEESPAFKLQKQMEQLKAALAPIGAEFVKAVTPLVEFGTKLLKSFNNLGEGGKQFVVILTTVAGVVAPAALMAFGLIANGVANLLKFFQFLGNAFGLLSGKSTLLGGQTEYMTQQQIEAAAVAASLGQSHSQLTQIFTAETSALRGLVSAYQSAIVEQQRFGIGRSAAMAARQSGGRVPGFASGGIVRGPGTGTSDSIFAMLSNGEAVVPAAVVRENPEAIKQLIAGNIPGYARGNVESLGTIFGGLGDVRKLSSSAVFTPGNRSSAGTDMDWWRSGGAAPEASVEGSLKGAMLASSGQRTTESSLAALDQLNPVISELTSVLSRAAQNTETFAQMSEQAFPELISTIDRWETAGSLNAQEAENLRQATTKTFGPDQDGVSRIPRVDVKRDLDTGETFVARNANSTTGTRFVSAQQVATQRARSQRGLGPIPEDYQWAHARDSIVQEGVVVQPRASANVPADVAGAMEQQMASGKKFKKGEVVDLGLVSATAQGQEDGSEYVNSVEQAVAQQAPQLMPTLLQAGGWNSPHPEWVSQGSEDGKGYSDAFEAASGVGPGANKSSLSGNLAAPKPPIMPEAAPPSMGKRFADKIADSGPGKFLGKKLAQASGNAITDSKGQVYYDPNEDPNTWAGKMTAKDKEFRSKLPGGSEYSPDLKNVAGGVTPVRVVNADAISDPLKPVDKVTFDPALEEAMESGKIQSENLAETLSNSTDVEEKRLKEDSAARKEQSRQNRQSRAGKALAGLGTLTMAAGMATQVEGVVGETAQKIVGPLAALSGIAPILMALPLPLAALVAVVGAGVWAFMSYNKMVNEAREKGYELTTALGNGEEAMNKFAKFAGTVSSSELLGQRVQNVGRIMEIQPGKSTFGQGFVSSEEGTEYVESIRESLATLGNSTTIQLVQRQLSQAILDEVLSLEQARSVVAAVGDELNNYGFAIDVSSQLIELVGPNGEDLFKDPLQLTAKIIQEQEKIASATASVIAESLIKFAPDSPEVVDAYVDQRMIDRQAAIADPGASWNPFSAGNKESASTMRMLDDILISSGVNYNDFIRNEEISESNRAILEGAGYDPDLLKAATIDPLGEGATQLLEENLRATTANDPATFYARFEEATKLNAENVGESIGMIENYYAALQSGMASIIVGAQDNIDAARESGDVDAINSAIEARDQAMADYAVANRENNDMVEAALLETSGKDRRTAFSDQKARATEGLEGDAKRSMETALGLVSGTGDEELVANVKIRTMLESGDLDPNVLTTLLGGKDGDERQVFVDAIANLSVVVGEDYATAAANIVAGLSGILDSTGTDISQQIGDDFILGINAAIDSGDLTEGAALDVIEGFGDLSKWRGVLPPDGLSQIFSDFAGDPAKILDMQQMQGELTGIDFDDAEAVEGAIGGRAKEALDAYRAAEGEAWDALSQKEREEFATILSVTLQYDGASWLAPFLQSQQEGDDTADVTLGKAYEQRLPSRTEVPTPEETTPKPTTDGGGSGPQLDSLLKKLRDVRDASISLKKGWEGMQQVLQSVFQGGTASLNVFDGLSNQIRKFGVGENLIEMIVGMDPDEFEKRKHELFIYNEGNIVGITDKLKNMNSAFNAIALGEYVNQQQKSLQSMRDQISAISILTANGLSLSEAYALVQDEALAAAIALGATKEEIAEIIRLTKEVSSLRKKTEQEQERADASKSVRKTNEEFEKRIAILSKLSQSVGQYTDAQIDAIMGDSNLQTLFLNPSIDQRAMQQAIFNASRNAEIELKVKLATTAGKKGVFEEGFSKAMESFGVQEQTIELKFKSDIKDDEGVIRAAESQIAGLQFQLDDYEAEITRIEDQEKDINDAYEKRFEALDKIAQANEQIAAAQKSQLDIADALTRGDIAAAARAAQEARSQQADSASKTQKEQLEKARDAQIGALTGTGGLNREQLDQRIRDLQIQIFNIEEDLLEPAQERIRLAQELRNEQILSLMVLGKTREEWEKIKNNVDTAQVNNWQFVEGMETALDIVDKLIEELVKSKPLPPPPPPPPPPPAPAPRAAPAPPQPSTYTVKSGDWLSKIAPAHGISTAALIAANPQIKNPNLIFPGQKINIPGKSSGGMIVPKRMAMGGRVKGYPMGGLIPYKANGGFFKSLGSDTVPAMLTPGEFVVRRPAVRGFGVDNLEKINNGTYADGSVYNYNLAVNVKSNSNPDIIARTVIKHIERVDSQKIRGNRI